MSNQQSVTYSPRIAVFFTDPFIFFFKSDEFLHAAHKLECIAIVGNEVWIEEMKKLDLKPGEWKVTKKSFELQMAERDQNCRRISIYLYAHSFELLLKGFYLKAKKTLNETHKITDLYEAIKEYISSSPHEFNESDIVELFEKLDEVLIWAGRYPIPRNNKYRNAAIETLAKTKLGYTSDIATSINLELLKKFRNHILNCFNKSAPLSKNVTIDENHLS